MFCTVGGYVSSTFEGGRMADNFEFFGDVFCLFWVLCLLYYYIIHIHA
jgi:hypothetical protein